MLYPEDVRIDSLTGEVTPETGRYIKRLSDLAGLYSDRASFDRLIADGDDPVVYEVIDYRKPQSDLSFGTTIIWPGKVGQEYFMTRGHFHCRRECGEVYYTQSGRGILILETREGESRTIGMQPGSCAFIPPDWAHRSVNTGSEKLVFAWFCATDAGAAYASILERGMRKLVVDRYGKPATIDNPRFL